MNYSAKSIFSKLGSPRTGFFLLGLLAVFSFTISFFPASELEGYSKFLAVFSMMSNTPPQAALTFQPRFESWIFIGLTVFLSLSLGASLFFRLRAEIRRQKRRTFLSIARPVDEFEIIAGKAAETLRQHHYKVLFQYRRDRTVVAGTKGESGIIGSVAFHSGLLVILLGIALSSVASFKGSVSITEGQEFDSGNDRYGFSHQGPFYRQSENHLSFRLAKLEPEYVVNGATTVASFLSVSSGSTDTQFPLYINHRIVIEGKEIHQGAKTGFSPYVRVTHNGEEILFEGFLRLASIRENDGILHRDFLKLDNGDNLIEFEFLPDAVFRNEKFTSRSESPDNPLLRVSANSESSNSNEQWISPGGTVRTGEFHVSFLEIRRWSQFDVVDDPGKNVMILGVLLGSIGLALRLLSTRRRVTISINRRNGRHAVEVSGTSEKFPAEFQAELSSLRTSLQVQLLDIEADDAAPDRLPASADKRSQNERVYEEVF